MYSIKIIIFITNLVLVFLSLCVLCNRLCNYIKYWDCWKYIEDYNIFIQYKFFILTFEGLHMMYLFVFDVYLLSLVLLFIVIPLFFIIMCWITMQNFVSHKFLRIFLIFQNYAIKVDLTSLNFIYSYLSTYKSILFIHAIQ